ncbi:hypothetical protein AMAG_20028 [Allomyces macrogynus ATCC 38327]|uniref:Uncharacterized protein n=1 Tax=Allomyces macrogynus (strain ATCC 38327) TaxID=578462 RepID=A0A0L0T4Q4_ALLM3|nr:hypothetical protein AMAG_20028 [Allomyces macrogynus ATCC 38327]|eukprot:KNE69717.1 hypothetical protein AMAG_20028 [Allomyces macrogynus ATCC 38327]
MTRRTPAPAPAAPTRPPRRAAASPPPSAARASAPVLLPLPQLPLHWPMSRPSSGNHHPPLTLRAPAPPASPRAPGPDPPRPPLLRLRPPPRSPYGAVRVTVGRF